MDRQTRAALDTFFPVTADFDAQAVSDLFAMSALVEEIERRIRALAERSGMPALQFFVLEQLALNGGAAPLSALIGSLNLAKQTATYVVAQLEKQGLIERRRSESDRRRFELVLSAQGRRTVKAKGADFYRTLLAATDGVSAAERSNVIAGLERLRAGLVQHADTPVEP